MSFLTRLRASALGACLLGCTALALSQANPGVGDSMLSREGAGSVAPALPESETIRARVDEVNLVFTVTDSSGRFVGKLSLNDLSVLDDQRVPERISYFEQQSGLPLRVGLLVDLSDSVTGRFEYEKKAAVTFLHKILRPGMDQAFLVGFASSVNLLQDFTSDVGALSRAVQGMRLGGNTQLYDAIQFAAGKLRNESGAGLSRRVIVVISDGVDTYSRGRVQDAIEAALRAETAVYALSSNEIREGHVPPGEAALELITRDCGGQVLRAHSKGEIGRAFSKVESALRSQYALGYRPAEFKADGRFRAIRILPRKHKLRVRCRRGYFAMREDQASAVHATAP